jgi:hypothetical protein
MGFYDDIDVLRIATSHTALDWNPFVVTHFEDELISFPTSVNTEA